MKSTNRDKSKCCNTTLNVRKIAAALSVAAMTISTAALADDAPQQFNDVVSEASPFDVELQPGEFVWRPDLSAEGQLHAYVDLGAQLVTVYRGPSRIGVSTISSGMPGHETPNGVFEILQKREEHYSNLYNDAPMPYMQRLTWDGIAFHVGTLPGEPASHGCIRLPRDFATALFELTKLGTVVEIVGSAGVEDESLAATDFRAPPLTPEQETAQLNRAAQTGTLEIDES